MLQKIIKTNKFRKKINKKQSQVINQIIVVRNIKKFINNCNNRQISHKKKKLKLSIILNKNKLKKNKKR